jgi:DNA gyrase subunit A
MASRTSKTKPTVFAPFDPDKVAEVESIDIAGVVQKGMPPYSRASNLREIPDARDGLIPVQRHILYAMAEELHLTADGEFIKSVRITADTMGKYHPHGDAAIYGAMESLAAKYKVRYPLIAGKGNWGSIDGDSPAAQRYTEAKFTKLGEQMVRDLFDEKAHILPYRDNFDNTLREPALLPSRFPALLANGIKGIGNGYATEIFPHNLRELVAACCALIDNPQLSIDKLAQILPGPDFPGGGIIVDNDQWKQILETGLGKVVLRAKIHYEKNGNDNQLIITEFPYRINKGKQGKKEAGVIKQIEDKTNGTPEDIAKGKLPLADIIAKDGVADRSDMRGIKLVITLRPGVSPERGLNVLLAQTSLQLAYHANHTAWDNGLPETLGTRDLLIHYLTFQFDLITRRTRHLLARDLDAKDVCLAKITAHLNSDEVVRFIKTCESTESVITGLMAKYKWSRHQAEAISDMALSTFAKLNIKGLKDRIANLDLSIKEYNRLLASKAAMNEQLKSELREIAAKFGDDRRTVIDTEGTAELKTAEEILPDEPCWLALSASGFVARYATTGLRNVKRSSAGGTWKAEEDPTVQVLATRTLDKLWLLSNFGNLYCLKISDLEEVARGARGTNVRRFLSISEEEKIIKLLTLPNGNGDEGPVNKELIIATAKGKIKRSNVEEYTNINSAGLRTLVLNEGDRIVEAFIAQGGQEIISFSSDGYAVRYPIDDKLPIQGRVAQGVASQSLGGDTTVEALVVIEANDHRNLTLVMANGRTRRTALSEFPTKGRATRGVIGLDFGGAMKSGAVNPLALSVLGENDLLVLTSKAGKTLILANEEIKKLGRTNAGLPLAGFLAPKDDGVANVLVISLPTSGEAVNASPKAAPAKSSGKVAKPVSAKPTASKLPVKATVVKSGSVKAPVSKSAAPKPTSAPKSVAPKSVVAPKSSAAPKKVPGKTGGK